MRRFKPMALFLAALLTAGLSVAAHAQLNEAVTLDCRLASGATASVARLSFAASRMTDSAEPCVRCSHNAHTHLHGSGQLKGNFWTTPTRLTTYLAEDTLLRLASVEIDRLTGRAIFFGIGHESSGGAVDFYIEYACTRTHRAF